ncbi:MAG: MmcQ/YjbR family DNA-binding protein [Pseudomonadota bacterium]
MMTRAQIDSICAAHPGATPSEPGQIDSWKVGGKSFVHFGGTGTGTRISVKTPDADTAAMLIDMGVAVRSPSFPPAWVRLHLDELDPDEAAHRIAVSYDTIRRSLPASVRATLPDQETV